MIMMYKHEREGEKREYQYPMGEVWVHILSLVTLTELFWYAACLMIRDVYPEWELTASAKGTAQLIILSAVMTVELGSRAFRHRTLWGEGILLLWGAYLVRHYRTDQEALISGLGALGRQYIGSLNAQLKTNYALPRGNPQRMSLTFSMIMLLLLLLSLSVTLMFQLRLLLLLLPVISLGLELMVGYSPEWQGVGCMFVGVVMLYAWNWNTGGKTRMLHRQEKRSGGTAVQLMTLCAAAVLAAGAFSGGRSVLAKPVERLVEIAPNIREFQRQLERELESFSLSVFRILRERVNNRTPRYRNREVLTVTASRVPLTELYLKGYYGTEYVGGSWDCSDDAFAEACREAGYEPEALAEWMASAYLEHMRENMYTDFNLLEYTIEYTGISNGYTYLPYFTGLPKEQYQLVGDYFVQKSFFEDAVTVIGWDRNMGIRNSSVMQLMAGTESGEQYTWSRWYSEYVLEQYLEVPDNIPALSLYTQAEGYREHYESLQIALQSEYTKLRNEARYYMASVVSMELAEMLSYETDLESVRIGVDAVQYFLMNSKKGYCKHFATAGALLLRTLGVPARYASGYIVAPEDFVRTEGGYAASVKDVAAHSWVEIYLDDIGWVPVEMTPGYSGNMGWTNFIGNGSGVPMTADEALEEIKKTEEADESDETVEDEADEENDIQESEEIEEIEEIEEAEKTPAPEVPGEQEQITPGAYGSGAESGEEGTIPSGPGAESAARRAQWRIFAAHVLAVITFLGILAVLVLLLVLIRGLLREAVRRYENILRRELREGRNRRAVCRISRRFYRRLLFRGKPVYRGITDTAYEKILAESYPAVSREDWHRYMMIVKEAAFAEKEPNGERAQFCYQLYVNCGRRRRRG